MRKVLLSLFYKQCNWAHRGKGTCPRTQGHTANMGSLAPKSLCYNVYNIQILYILGDRNAHAAGDKYMR